MMYLCGSQSKFPLYARFFRCGTCSGGECQGHESISAKGNFLLRSFSPSVAFGSQSAGDFLRRTGRTKEEFPLPPFIIITITISGEYNEGLSV